MSGVDTHKAWQFADVLGQDATKARLLSMIDSNHMPHALMLHGTSGVGKMALLLAVARYLLCKHPADGKPCEDCPSCHMTAGWSHPDLHFSFPVIKKKSSDHPVSDNYLTQWREMLQTSPYFDPNDWLEKLGAENQQLQFYVEEAESLQHKLSIKSSQGGNRVIIMWLPEKMGEAMANKLLKLIEEPPAYTYFLLASERPEEVLGTIQSRTQMLHVSPLDEKLIAEALQTQKAVPEQIAVTMAHMAQGSYTRACQELVTGNDRSQYFDSFVELMRKAYMKDINSLRRWAEQAAALGRERQKALLQYFQLMVRENFMYNFNMQDQLNYQSKQESEFAQKFARFIHENNIIPITEMLSDCQRDIECNVSAKMVFFDMAVKMILLIKINPLQPSQPKAGA